MFNWVKSKFADRSVANAPSPAAVVEPQAHARALCKEGNAWLDKGNTGAALASYEKAVALDPRSADSLVSLGFALSELGRFDEAHRRLAEAVALDPTSHDAHYLLGSASHALNRPEEAIAGWREALARKPDFELCRSRLIQTLAQSGDLAAAEAVAVEGRHASPLCADMPFLLGNIHVTRGELDEAVDSFGKAVKIKPDFAQAHQALGEVLKRQGHRIAAIESHRRCVTLSPADASARARLAAALHDDGQLQAAVSAYRQALALDEHHAESYANMGYALHQLGRDDDSVASYRKAIALQPDSHDVHTSLGDTLSALSRLEEGVEAYRQALVLSPDDQRATNNMAGTLLTQGKIDIAIALLGKSTAIDADNILASSNMLFALNYHPDKTAEEIFAAYVDFDRRFGLRWQDPALAHANERNTTRRLRVGYISPDFRRHAVQHFLPPLLDHHDKAVVEVFAYADLLVEDAVTPSYKRQADHWVPIAGKTDEQVAARVREDRIDILVDLAGHTSNNRMGVFARKPAPVSVSWLGFGYTTGLSAIDYFLSDATAAPAGSEHLFAEQVWRVPTPSYAYRPNVGMGEVGPLPAERRGFVTFGTLTRAIRMNHRVVRTWAQILLRVPGSRLVIDSVNYQDAATRDALLGAFAEHGIGAERLAIGFHSPPWDTMRSIDIGLDCFPHNSGTTLFESLYMGLPYITLAGRPSVGRLGSTILEGAGHPEWIAHSEDEYVDKAVALASDPPRLAALRQQLRADMQASPLMDEVAFARKVEAAYCSMFARWAETPTPSTPVPHARAAALVKQGHAAEARGQFDEAEGLYRAAIAADDTSADAWMNLGTVLAPKGAVAEAVAAYERAIALDANHASAHYNLGLALLDGGDAARVEQLFRSATQLRQPFPQAFVGLALALESQGRLSEAADSYREALRQRPDDADALANLGALHQRLSEPQAAIERYAAALRLAPDRADLRHRMGLILKDHGQIAAAINCYRQALVLMPGHAELLGDLGNALQEQGDIDGAVEKFEQALALKPDHAGGHGNLLFTLNYHPDKSAESIFDAYRVFDQRFGAPHRGAWREHSNARATDRVLRVGYVSPDFCMHPVRHFLEPLLAHHDAAAIHVTAYAELRQDDAVTARYRSLVQGWVDTRTLDDDALAQRIRDDAIDILVDLAGHTAHNRLGVFARKPAPVSLSWLGFGYTTGVSAINYLLTDAPSAPEDSEPLFAEAPWRLPGTCYAYRPALGMGAVGESPAAAQGGVTFGTLTRSVRINHHTIRVWSALLNRVPGSRLLVDSKNYGDAGMCDELAAKFAAHGIPRERLELGVHSPPWDVMRSIDIGLDCFPHNSGTTLFETLYMGIPFVTLAGRPSVGRLGSSVLHGVGHPEWIADSERAYVDIAVALATDLPRLAHLRSTLRGELQASELMDEAAFARKVEAAYRDMFARWAASAPAL